MADRDTQESIRHTADDEVADRIRAALKEYQGLYLDQLTSPGLKGADCLYVVAPLPANFDERLRYLGNMLAQMCMAVPKKNERLKVDLRMVATALSYLINSTSFQTDEYHDFDRAEISRKLGRRAS